MVAPAPSFVIVGLIDPPTRLAVCPDETTAAEFLERLPGVENGLYYLDHCTDTVILDRALEARLGGDAG